MSQSVSGLSQVASLILGNECDNIAIAMPSRM